MCQDEADHSLALGSCCYCEAAPASVIAMLDFKVPAAEREVEGWGCALCGLPPEGALTVFCEGCARELERNEPVATFFFAAPMICLGYPQENRRARVEAIRMEPHEHDLRFHPEARGDLMPNPELNWPPSLDYGGPPCPRKCHLCPDAPEHHWMIDFGEMDDDGEVEYPEGYFQCKHCGATRTIPDDDAFQEAFFT